MYRRHFLLFAGISVILAIPSAALSGYTYYSLFSSFLRPTSAGVLPDFGSLTPALVAFGTYLVVGVALAPFTYGAVTYAACESALGRPVTPGGIVKGILQRYFQLLGFWLLVGLMLYVGFCLIPLWIWIWVGWVAVIPVMFVENIGLGAAMGRSWRLVEGRWWRTFLVLFLLVIITAVLRVGLAAFLVLAEQLLLVVASQYVVLAITQATNVIIDSLVNPVLQIAIVLIYFDLRVRREALDLFQLAQRVSAAAPSL
jgi:hypothetical protein